MKRILLLSFVILLILGCQKFSSSKSEIVAQVNQETLTMAELQSMFSPDEWKAMSIDQKRDFIRQWIDLTLLSQSAKEMKLENNKQVKERIKLADKKVLTNALIAEKLKSVQVSEEELFNYYRVHMGDFNQVGKIIKVQRIFLHDRARVDEVMTELRKGMNFADAARAYSQEALGQNGGYAGTVSVSDSVRTFWDALQNVKIYEIVIVTANGGYYLVRSYEEQLGSGTPTFDTLRDEIRKRVVKEKQQQIYDELLKELKSTADISISI
ncbi:MAG TPA: peptidylprolyl isomerase [Candidatus Cloacimonadota bacterium]|nr:peptidylprolyl isomerase [Candidatus Cloacimonadota bacterium]HPT72771.1 peptidylprolyl isomerase [Candidatus Cloacimonadota bacterium]